MYRRPLLFSLFFALSFTQAFTQDLYTELYRPQFHPSPRTGFMGDPNGPIKFAGKYHLFWWGHMVSDDMIHWTELTSNALKGTPSGYGNWSGSVVVDINNTGGFNTAEDTAMIAVYTLNENSTGIQSQAISVSLNHGSFDYYTGNPVIPSNQRDFRDPQVFWHQETGKWVMVVTKPVERAIEFYTSPDLKTWSYESKFDGKGARKEVWEVPDLFQVPVNGNQSTKKWVLTCGMGPNRMQYWVGDFDGTKFTLDAKDNLTTGNHFPGEMYENFEANYGNWTLEGTAFGSAPASGSLGDQQEVMGFTGIGLVNSFLNGDGSTGKLISPSFVVEKRFITFQIGGGAGSGLGVKIMVDGAAIATVTSTSNTEILQWRSVDVSNYVGKNATIEIVDEATGGWGHILVDHIVFSDFEYDTRVENANWADWGYDFYAGKTYRNYDFDDTRKIWIAWMGNWAYARDVPTNPWKGCESIPRELSLMEDETGYRLIQKPVEELQALRISEFSKSDFTIEGTQVSEFHPDWNVYELYLEFKVTGDNKTLGLNLAEGEDRRVEIRYDSHTSILSIDRGTEPFGFAYKMLTKTPVFLKEDSVLDLHIFIDQSSLEVFANDYETSTTSLFFNDVTATGISLFSESGTVEVIKFSAWDLKSIWGISADDVEKPEKPSELLGLNQERYTIYPNPVLRGSELQFGFENPQKVELWDLSGDNHFFFENKGAFVIPSDITPGIYVLTHYTASSQSSIKILIQ